PPGPTAPGCPWWRRAATPPRAPKRPSLSPDADRRPRAPSVPANKARPPNRRRASRRRSLSHARRARAPAEISEPDHRDHERLNAERSLHGFLHQFGLGLGKEIIGGLAIDLFTTD